VLVYVGMFVGCVVILLVNQVLIYLFFSLFFSPFITDLRPLLLFFLTFFYKLICEPFFVLLLGVDERVFISVFGNIKLKALYCLI